MALAVATVLHVVTRATLEGPHLDALDALGAFAAVIDDRGLDLALCDNGRN